MRRGRGLDLSPPLYWEEISLGAGDHLLVIFVLVIFLLVVFVLIIFVLGLGTTSGLLAGGLLRGLAGLLLFVLLDDLELGSQNLADLGQLLRAFGPGVLGAGTETDRFHLRC